MKILEYRALKDIRAMVLSKKDLVTCVKAYRALVFNTTGEDVGLYQAKKFCEYIIKESNEGP